MGGTRKASPDEGDKPNWFVRHWKWLTGGTLALVGAISAPFIYKKFSNHENPDNGVWSWSALSTPKKVFFSVLSLSGLYWIWNYLFTPTENDDGQMVSPMSRIVGTAPPPPKKTWWQRNGCWFGVLIIGCMGGLAMLAFWLLCPGSFHDHDAPAPRDIEEGPRDDPSIHAPR